MMEFITRLFGRRVLPPARKPTLDRDERVLAWAATGDDETAEVTAAATVVVTNRGLWWGGSRTGWHEITKATWDGTALTVIPAKPVTQRAGYDVIADGSPVRLTLADPGHVPHQVRLRVTASVSYPRHYPLSDAGGKPAGGVWVAGRRVPGVDGLSWIVRYDPGTDGEDPAIAAFTDQMVTAAIADATAHSTAS
jgi:hypothetical protein